MRLVNYYREDFRVIREVWQRIGRFNRLILWLMFSAAAGNLAATAAVDWIAGLVTAIIVPLAMLQLFHLLRPKMGQAFNPGEDDESEAE